MKHQGLKLLTLFVLLIPVMTIAARNTRTGFCNDESSDVTRSKGCGSKCKRFCAVTACCAVINGQLTNNGTLTVNGVDLSSSNALASTILGTGLVEPKLGYAEFVSTTTDNEALDGSNVFLFDRELINNTSGAVVAAAAAGGTVFTLTQGTYVIDYEAVISIQRAFALYRGATVGTLALDTNTISGTMPIGTALADPSDGFTRGRVIIEVAADGEVVALSAAGTALVRSTGGVGNNPSIIRITFLKIA